MNNKSILSTQFAQSLDMKHQILQVIKYLTFNRAFVLGEQQVHGLLQQRTLLPNIIDKVFEQCVNTGFINEFASLLPQVIRGDVHTNIPDLLTMKNITIDLKDNPDAHPLESYSELKDKIILNLAELVKRDSTGNVRVSDISEMHSMYVRGMLVRSYDQSDAWLTPQLCTYIIQAYSMSISSVIARNENLNLMDQLTVASIFALYMAQKLSSKNDDLTKPSYYFRCTFLGTMRDLDELANKMAHISKDGLTINSACELVAELGPQRLQKFNPGVFYRACTSLGASTDKMSTMLALEYPPYFVMILLRAIDGFKMGSIGSYLKQHNLMNAGKVFGHGLITCRALFESR